MKVFSLRAEVVERELMRKSHMGPARKMDAWGYNGSVPGLMIEVVEGDRARVIFNLGMDHRPIHMMARITAGETEKPKSSRERYKHGG
ncbi:MAG TPA: hypothetical protein VIM99_07515 [Blastocatellia bacterium]